MDIDPTAILASLGISGASSVAPVTGGADTLIWRIEHNGKSYALRLFRADQQEASRREVIAMRAAASIAPVPKIIAQGLWQDRPAVLLEWCEGEPLLHYLMAHPEAVHDLGVEFGRLHAHLNAVPAPSDLTPPMALFDYVQWLDPTLADRMRALPPQPPALLHLDYHFLNVLTDGKRITAVIDWVNAMPGDPRADFARTVSIFRIAPFAPRSHELHWMRRTFERVWRQGYLEVAGTLTDLPLFYAIAGKAMLPEYAPRVASPDQLNPLRRWTRYWQYCAGT
jgi:aminoglycoside phosphotransferase (APT) family kinase protein